MLFRLYVFLLNTLKAMYVPLFMVAKVHLAWQKYGLPVLLMTVHTLSIAKCRAAGAGSAFSEKKA